MHQWLIITRAFVVVVTWIMMNFLLQVFNKFMFDTEKFRYPVLIILCGTLTTFFGSAISVFVLKIDRFDKKIVQNHWPLILLTAVTYAFGTAFQNMSIEHISITMNQIIKATTPFFTLFLSMWWEQKHYTRAAIFSTVIQVIGAGMVLFRNPTFELYGFISALASALCNVGNIVVSALLLQRCFVSPIMLTLLTTLPAAICITPLFYMLEFKDLEHHSYSNNVVLLLLFCSILAYFYNIVHYLVILYTSSMYSALLSNVKVIVIVALAMFVYQNPFTFINVIGLVVSLGGFCYYNWLRFEENKAKNLELPTVEDDFAFEATELETFNADESGVELALQVLKSDDT